jgi:hypothetical protein
MVEAGSGREQRSQWFTTVSHHAKIALGGAILLLTLAACTSVILLARLIEIVSRREI